MTPPNDRASALQRCIARKNHSDLNKVANSRNFQQKPEAAGTNTRSAPRRHAPRRPCCSLCSARARSGLRTTQSRASVGTWLGRSATSSGPPCPPPSESLRLPSPTSQPKRLVNEERRFHSETAGASMKLRKGLADRPGSYFPTCCRLEAGARRW